MIGVKEIIALLTENTKITNTQAKSLADAIAEYDEPDTILYEVIGQLNNGIPLKSVKADILEGNFGWKSEPFLGYRQERDLKDKLLVNPPEVREGDIECPRCGLTKTIVVEGQTRSADEGFTYKVHCFNPKCMAVS